MSENKDQNRDGKQPDGTNSPNPVELVEQAEINPEQDLADIDQILGEEDPNFLNQLAEINIPVGTSLASLDAVAVRAIAKKESFLAQIKKVFNFKENPKIVVSFWLALVFAGVVITFTWKNKVNFLKENLFLNSYATWNPAVQDYNPLSETEPFYDNPRFSKNLMTLSKMFINVKPSENSGSTPMLALEVNVEGISADAIIEIKDREAEFKDLLLRFVEERTYDELTTTEGKQNLCDQFRIIINSHLTQGQVRRVLLNSFIIKP